MKIIKKNTLLEDETVPIASDLNPQLEIELRFDTKELKKAIGKLKGAQQKVITMRFIDGFSYQEISQTLRKSEGAIRVIQYRALLELRKIIKIDGSGNR